MSIVVIVDIVVDIVVVAVVVVVSLTILHHMSFFRPKHLVNSVNCNE